MRRIATTFALVLVASVPLRAGEPAGTKPAYPETRRENVVDTLHGVQVADPYRWLEDDDSKEVEAWDRAQAAILRARLDAFPDRAKIKERLETELNLGGIASLPTFRGDVRFYTSRPAGKNHPILYVTDAEGKGPGRVVIDPNEWSADGTVGMKGWTASPDGANVAYEKDLRGSENSTLYVREVATGKDLPERITRTKFTSVAWMDDGKGFYFSRMPPADSVPEGEEQYHRRIYAHRLGALPIDDVVVYGQGRPKIEDMWVSRSGDEKHLFVGRGMPYKALDTFDFEEKDGATVLTPVLVGNDSRTFVDRVGDLYLLNTDLAAPRRRLCVAKRGETMDPKKWKEILPQGVAVIENAVIVGDAVVVQVRENVVSRLEVVGLDGTARGEIGLPSPGSVNDVAVKPGDTRIWFTFESYSRPLTTYVCDVAAKGRPLTALATLPTTVNPEDLVSEQMEYASKDGTKIPLFVLRAKGTRLDTTAPTILYGYGGFRVGMYPRYSRSRGLWAAMGGVFAVAVLRGGDEFGEDWHVAGSMGKKQNVFDDFIAGADWLVSTGKACREKLAIQGGSNGGLLVAACANQRPDLCHAVVCQVPLTDMIRYHKFAYALEWTNEYGNPDDPDAFRWIFAYSPYHNVKPGAAYPAALVTAGITDGRVEPFHARKIVAQWQAATSSDRPILLFLDRDSGHGSSSLQQAKAEILDQWCFLLGELLGSK